MEIFVFFVFFFVFFGFFVFFWFFWLLWFFWFRSSAFPSPSNLRQIRELKLQLILLSFLWDQKKHLQGTGASIFLKSIIFLFLSSLWTKISQKIAVLHTPQQSFLNNYEYSVEDGNPDYQSCHHLAESSLISPYAFFRILLHDVTCLRTPAPPETCGTATNELQAWALSIPMITKVSSAI